MTMTYIGRRNDFLKRSYIRFKWTQSPLVAQTIKCLPAKQEISLSSVRGKKREFNLPPHLSVDQGLTQTTPHPPPPERRNARLEDATSTWRIRTLPGPVRTLALEAPPPPPPTAFHIPTHFYTCSKFRHTLIHMQAQPRTPSGLTRTHPGVSGIERTPRLHTRRCMHISAYMRVNAH